MLTLERNNTALSTTENFSVTIEDQNPATDFENIQGAKGVGGTVPKNANNRLQLRNPERFEKMGEKNSSKFEGYRLRHNGQVILSGTLIVDKTTPDYSFWLRDVVGNLAERVAGKYINQSALGGEMVFNNKANYDPLTDDYCCPRIFNRHFWRDRGKLTKVVKDVTDPEGDQYKKLEEIGNLTYQFLQNEQYFVNFPTPGGIVAGGQDNAPVVSPFMFLWKSVELILKDHKIFVTENFLKDDPELRKLCIYHNFSIAQQSFSTEDNPVSAYDYYSDGLVDLYTKVITHISWATDKFQYKDLLPKMDLGKFILGIENLFNVVFDFNGDDEVRILDREQLLLSQAFDLDEYAVGEWEMGERKDVCIKLSMENDGNDAAFADVWQDLSDLRDFIKEPVQQLQHLPTPDDLKGLTLDLDDIRLVTGESRYYQYHWFTPATDDVDKDADILDWEPISIMFQPFFYNDGDRDVEEITASFGTLRRSDNGYPLVLQPGNCAAFRSKPVSFSPRLFFYLGDSDASFETGNLSLDFAGEKGIAAKRYKYTLPFWANRLPAKRTFRLPASIFWYLRQNKAAMAFRTREGSFIIDKLEGIADKTAFVETKLEVFKREDNFWDYETGETPGSGGQTPPQFQPAYVGLASNGQPYLVNGSGAVRTPPSWDALSPAPYAAQCTVDYDPVNRLLFVAASGGKLNIFDLSDPDNLAKKTIRIVATGQISAVRYLNGKILIGMQTSKNIYQQPHHDTLAAYADYQATGAGALQWPLTLGFEYHDNYYYACTYEGEIWRSNNLSSWAELTDRNAHWWSLIQTTNKLLTFGKEDGDSYRRQFYAPKSNPTNWIEFSVAGLTKGYYVNEAVPLVNDQALLITHNKEYGGARVLMSDNSVVTLTPPLARYCAGACLASGGSPAIAIQEGTGATKIAQWMGAIPPVPGSTWIYTNVPVFFQKLFKY